MTLKKAVEFYPDKTAVVDGERSFTYARIGERVAGLARFFQSLGIEPEDRISILEVNSHAFLETYYAAAGIGAILNPLNYRLAAQRNRLYFKRLRVPLAAGQHAVCLPGTGLIRRRYTLGRNYLDRRISKPYPDQLPAMTMKRPLRPTRAILIRSRSGKTMSPIFTTPAAPPAVPKA